ncbi:MAG: hypothetical protein AAF436_02470 [Myxococcota bacterium]
MTTERVLRFVDIVGSCTEVFNESLGGVCRYAWMAITHQPATREAPETFTLYLLRSDDIIVDTVQRGHPGARVGRGVGPCRRSCRLLVGVRPRFRVRV